jgi:PhnB protein
MTVKPIPDGYHSLTPYITVSPASDAIRWYVETLGAEEVMRLPAGDRIAHAEIRIGDSMLMLSDEMPERGAIGPKSLGGTTASFLIYLDDVDAAFTRAIGAGAVEESKVTDQFYGDRSGTFVDPFGHRWTLATHVEDVSEEEMGRRMAAMHEPA